MAADTDKQQKNNGLKDYGIIYISGAINSGTAESVSKETIDLNIKREVLGITEQPPFFIRWRHFDAR